MLRLQLLGLAGVTAIAFTACKYFLVRQAASSGGPRTDPEYLVPGCVSTAVFTLLELHDAPGHYLTALSVHLQLATKLGGAEGKKAVSDAYLLVRMLLSDVRHMVHVPEKAVAA